MVLGAAAGKAAHKGMSAVFVEAMHRKAGLRVGVAYIIVGIVSFLVLKYAGIVMVVGSTLAALVMVLVAQRNFGGVTGDVLGATNEIARVISLLSVLVIIKWV
jgi:adenosylcobinamide-GDP ribazoletransferase